MKVLICGDRKWTDYDMIRKVLEVRNLASRPITVIHGGCKGADTLAGRAASDLGVGVQVFEAQWEKFGNAAGPIRNKRMLEEGKPEEVWAFHDDLEHSKGTKDMVTQAKLRKVPVYFYKHEG